MFGANKSTAFSGFGGSSMGKLHSLKPRYRHFFCMLERTKNEAQSQIFISLGPQMADISVNIQMANFNTGQYGDPSLKFLKSFMLD